MISREADVVGAEPLVIGFDDILAARDRIAGAVHRTPVLTSRLLNERCGRELFFKCENMQRAGAFKIRGATNKIRSLSPKERERGIVAFSSGNHAQAVALAAGEAGLDAVIVMPVDVPRAKREATMAYGARVVDYDRLTEDREEIARRIVEEEGRVLVPPYDDPFVMAGQGTAALELLDDVPDLDAVVVPVGGGGLLAGTATALLGFERVRAYGAEPAAADDTARSLEVGRRITIDPPDTIADGARVQTPGALTFPIVRARAEAVVRVADDSLVRAIELLLSRMKIVVEPTGALAAAAALDGEIPAAAGRIGVLLSGGNTDPATLARLIAGVPGE
ncbi:MAG: pyridoxal-phosphate dependent enzyme [Gemmatimonadota bacterium]